MPMTEAQLQSVLGELRRARSLEWPRLMEIRQAYLNEAKGIYVPKEATREYDMLVDQARFNLVPLLVKTLAQNLFVDGYRPTGESGRPSSDNSPIWDRVWQPNRMDSRQAKLHRGAIKYGYGYATVLPGQRAGERVPKIKPWSPLWLTALYEDATDDEWPVYAMSVSDPFLLASTRTLTGDQATALLSSSVLGPAKIRVYDDEAVYTIPLDYRANKIDLTDTKVERHNLGVCPVVRYIDEVDDDNLSLGKIEPQIPTQRQLNQTTFSLLITQQTAAFRQRWVTGMEIERDEQGNVVAPWNAAVNRVWQSDSVDTRFGDFAESDLSGYLNSRQATILFMAVTGQVPPHALLVASGISNISADALVALEAAHRHDVAEHKTSFGESHEQLLRLAGLALGGDDGQAAWEDTSAQVVWRDTQPRSLAEVADALGKLATMLNIPVEALWERIPNVTDQDLERWKAMRSETDVLDELSALVNGEAQDPIEPQEPDGFARNGAAPAPA